MPEVACTNFGGCWIADDAGKARLLDAALGACPNCGKSLASPHSLAFREIARDIAAGETAGVNVEIRFGNKCKEASQVFLIVDGEDIDSVLPASEQNEFEFPASSPGIYSLQARLETGDGYRTFSDARLIYVARPINPALPLLIWALLIVLLLCVAQYLGVFGKLGMPSWASRAAEVASVVSALMIGGLLLDLGQREKSANGAGSLVRPDQLASNFKRSDQILNRAGGIASSSVALTAFGALPFCLGAACLASVFFEQYRTPAFLLALALSIFVAAGIFWREELRDWSGKASSSQAAALPQPEPPLTQAQTDTQPTAAAVPVENDADGASKPEPDGGKA